MGVNILSLPSPLNPLPPEADKPIRGGEINKDAIHPRAQHEVFWHNSINIRSVFHRFQYSILSNQVQDWIISKKSQVQNIAPVPCMPQGARHSELMKNRGIEIQRVSQKGGLYGGNY